MKTKNTKGNFRRAVSRGRSRIPILGGIAPFAAALVGAVTSLLLLIFLRRKPTGRPQAPGELQEEERASAESRPAAADDDPQIFNLKTFRYLTIFMVGLVVFALVAGALLSGSFLPGHSILITPVPSLLPPGPRLEQYPGQTFPSLHATQEAGLNSYGWVDRQKGIVHIPIEQAMEMIAKSQLPVATGTPVAATPYAP